MLKARHEELGCYENKQKNHKKATVDNILRERT